MSRLKARKLKEKAQVLLTRLRGIREAGAGSVPMSEVLELVGAEMTPKLRREIEARGPLEVRTDGDGHARFSNSGPAFSVPVGPAELTAPEEIAGKLIWEDGGVALIFDPRKTVLAKAFALELKVERLEVSERHTAVRFPGGAFDQEWRF